MSPALPARPNSRLVIAIAIVAALHVAALAAVMMLRHEPLQAALESHVMTAQLLPPTPAAQPAAVQSIAPSPKPAPPVRTKPKVQPKPAPALKPTPMRTPPPLPREASPSPTPVTAADPAPPAPAAAAAPPVAAAPAISRETMEISAPKNVLHVECSIAKPDYPSLSRRRGETGTAYVRFVVGLNGKLESIELKKSSGFSRLDDAALAAVHASACKPYLENGQPVRAAYAQPFDFSLTD